MQHALIVEDLPHVRSWLSEVVQAAFPDIRLYAAAGHDEAMALLGGQAFDLALVDLVLPDGSGIAVVRALRERQPAALPVVVTIYDGDDHIFPALQAGAFGYLLKEQPREVLAAQLRRMAQGEPPLSPAVARRVLAHFAAAAPAGRDACGGVVLTARETEVLQRIAKGYTQAEIALQLGLSRHTVADHVKKVYRKLNVSSRAEATLEAARRGLVQP